jgi:hypothetical protein
MPGMWCYLKRNLFPCRGEMQIYIHNDHRKIQSGFLCYLRSPRIAQSIAIFPES